MGNVNIFSKLIYAAVLITMIIGPAPVSPKDQFVEPLLFGMKVNVPYDMANLFTRFPVQGVLSAILGIGLAAILFFGVITAPFGYMFGVPSEKYVLGDFAFHKTAARMLTDDIDHFDQSSVLLDYVRSEMGQPRTIFSDQRGSRDEGQCCQTFLTYFDAVVGYLDYWEPGFLRRWKPSLRVLRERLGGKVGKEIVSTVESSLSVQYEPDYESSMFYMISGKERDIWVNPACQQRIVCHAHGALVYFPETTPIPILSFCQWRLLHFP